MDKSLKDSLVYLGLGTKEVRFLETAYELGPSTINEIAKKSRLQRSTAYLIASELLEKGFLEEDFKEYKKRVFALEPKKILQKISNRQRQLRRQEIELEEKLPTLEAHYQSTGIKPKVRVYEGNNGLLTIWKDILSSKSELLLWTNQETENEVFTEDAHNRFIAERLKKNIQIRVLAVNNAKGKELLPLDTESKRQTKILPEGVTFSAETYIYDNKVAILDYNKDIIGIIIESEPINTAQKAIFESNWGLVK